MGASFGHGILDFLADSVDGTDAKLAFLDAFAALGLTFEFREVVDGRVVELKYNQTRGPVRRWLPDDEARPVLAAARKIGGSAPYSMFPGCMERQLYLPSATSSAEESVTMPGSPIDGWEYASLRGTYEALRERRDLIESGEIDEDVRFIEVLLANLALCLEHDLLFTIGY